MPFMWDGSTRVYMDLTGYEFEGQIRETPGASAVAAAFTFNLYEVTRDGQTFKAVEITLDEDISDDMAEAVYSYDIFWTPPSGHREQILRGQFQVEAATTR